VEGNCSNPASRTSATVLHALRYDIAVERVEAPTRGAGGRPPMAQRGVPVNAWFRAIGSVQRPINEVVFAECASWISRKDCASRVIEAIQALFEYIDWIVASKSSLSPKSER